MSLYIPKMSDTPAITIPGLADNFEAIDSQLSDLTYEEGVWTPVLTDTSGNPISLTNSIGQYIRIGNKVTCWFRVTKDANLTTGVWVLLRGLPFSPRNQFTFGGVATSSKGSSTSTRVVTHPISVGVPTYIYNYSDGTNLGVISGNLRGSFAYYI